MESMKQLSTTIFNTIGLLTGSMKQLSTTIFNTIGLLTGGLLLGCVLAAAIANDIYERVFVRYGVYTSVQRLLTALLFHRPAIRLPTPSEKLKQESKHGQACVAHLIEEEGFGVDEHTVQTEDGYILSLIHIKNPSSPSPPPPSKGVVLLQHGLFQTSLPFVFNKEQSLAFHLLRAGFDPWLCNSRGNLYSRGHVEYAADSDDRFWDFSIDDLPLDMQANVDYVRAQTGAETVTFIGHSQGAALAFAALSSRPQLRESVSLLVAASPGGYVTNEGSNLALRGLVHLHHQYPRVFRWLFGQAAFLPLMEEMRSFFGLFIFHYLSYTMFAYLLNQHDTYWEKSRKHWFYAESPGGASSRCVEHWLQLLKSREFRKYDYGVAQNTDKYGCEKPPAYDLSSVTVPTAVVWGRADEVLNVEKLLKTLPNVVKNICVDHHAHMDNLNAVDTVDLVYEPICQLIEQQQQQQQQAYKM